MIRTESTQKPTEPSQPEQQVKDMQRMLAKAEQTISKLQAKVVGQKQQVRELQAQAKHEDNLAAQREELKAEIAALKSETRELIRANREHVEEVVALQTENAKLKADAKVRKPSGRAAGADLPRMLQPSLF
jgi:erythromycin esterase-like protein